jgi:hypothetical protein
MLRENNDEEVGLFNAFVDGRMWNTHTVNSDSKNVCTCVCVC